MFILKLTIFPAEDGEYSKPFCYASAFGATFFMMWIFNQANFFNA